MRGDTGNIHGGEEAYKVNGHEDTAEYNVFVRDWWRIDEKGNRVPYPGAPRKYIARGVSYHLAKELCEEYRAKNDPGPESRKAEFEEV